jgi:hypothetical protein
MPIMLEMSRHFLFAIGAATSTVSTNIAAAECRGYSGPGGTLPFRLRWWALFWPCAIWLGQGENRMYGLLCQLRQSWPLLARGRELDDG